MEGFPLEVMTELKSKGRMALTSPGMEGGTSHTKRADVMGTGFTILRKREVMIAFLNLHIPILK